MGAGCGKRSMRVFATADASTQTFATMSPVSPHNQLLLPVTLVEGGTLLFRTLSTKKLLNGGDGGSGAQSETDSSANEHAKRLEYIWDTHVAPRHNFFLLCFYKIVVSNPAVGQVLGVSINGANKIGEADAQKLLRLASGVRQSFESMVRGRCSSNAFPVGAVCRALGAKHAVLVHGKHFNSSMFDTFLVALVEVIRENPRSQPSAEDLEIWSDFVEKIVSMVKEGLEYALI